MNDLRRSAIQEVIDSLEILKDKVMDLQTEEQKEFDNLSELQQSSEYAHQILNTARELTNAYDEIENAIDLLDSAKERYTLQPREIIDELMVYVFNSTKSVDLLDKFEGYLNSNDPIYKRIVIKNSEYIRFNEQSIYCHLVIERSPNLDYVGDITFTEFKQGKTGELWQHIRSELNEEIIETYKNANIYYHLKNPYRLRAQNSHNRTGYGWEWDWTNGYGDYTEGTYYGETTDYIFSGVYISTSYGYNPELREKKTIV